MYGNVMSSSFQGCTTSPEMLIHGPLQTPPARSPLDLCDPAPMARKGQDRQDPLEPTMHRAYVGWLLMFTKITLQPIDIRQKNTSNKLDEHSDDRQTRRCHFVVTHFPGWSEVCGWSSWQQVVPDVHRFYAFQYSHFNGDNKKTGNDIIHYDYIYRYIYLYICIFF